MKKVVLVILGILLMSCGGSSNTVTTSSLSSDLKELLMQSEFDSEVPFAIAYQKAQEDDDYLYTIKVSYNALNLNNIKIIAVPLAFNENNNINTVTNVGYDHVINLKESTNEASFDFKAISLTYKYSLKDGIKVRVEDDNTKYYCSIDEQTLFDE